MTSMITDRQAHLYPRPRVAPSSAGPPTRRQNALPEAQYDKEGPPDVTTTTVSGRFTSLPDGQTLASTVTALEEHGFSVEVVDDIGAAHQAVLARIPHGSSVMTNTSVTL